MSEEQSSESEKLSFDEILRALQDETQPFPARYLYRLSALEGNDLSQLKRAWPQLSAQRRLGLLEDLELLTEGNTVVNFENVDRLGLHDRDARVRVVALRSLLSSEQDSLVPILVELMQKDENTEVRAQAAASLGRFVYLGEVGNIPSGKLKEVEIHLLDIMNSDVDSLIRQRALESLGYSSRPEVAELIENAYQSNEEDWMVSALFAMGRSADDRWAPLVLESLQDAHVELTKEAARAAGELELNEARPVLFDLLHAEDSDVRLAAAWALSQIGGSDVADALDEMIERTEDEDEADLIENAIENLALTDEMSSLNLLDFSPEDLEELARPDREENGDQPAQD